MSSSCDPPFSSASGDVLPPGPLERTASEDDKEAERECAETMQKEAAARGASKHFDASIQKEECASEEPVPSVPADPLKGELSVRAPKVSATSCASKNSTTGLHELKRSDGGRQSLLYVPTGYNMVSIRPLPLLVWFHGAGCSASNSLPMVQHLAEQLDIMLLLPSSKEASWDVISGRSFGPDVREITEHLKHVLSAYSIDPQRIGISGFSDGASYALSLGMINGDLFSHILAFSPGFMVPTRIQGSPSIFMCHGTEDRVLPIDRCSRRLAKEIRQIRQSKVHGLDYIEFDGAHTVPSHLLKDGMVKFVTRQ